MYLLKTVQRLPISIEEAWDFFSSPKNLKDITPAYMGFTIINDIPDKMYPGMIIRYKLSPFPGYRVKWTTEITQLRQNEYFIDTQLDGPYKIWHHEHHFREIQSGVEMTDILHYKLPFGLLGSLVHAMFIRKKVAGIFSYRREVLERRFPQKVKG